ncbi:hypothetical protein QVD17_08809 [Tagetes erecta]|uniref:Uncharacterized protein n=1 Tax=Tagetes erecta TaxID=13708 RepID=A0AAD8P4F0_TARER|nr:hypothetical protein QVD17_08809 [Tagetes erecta]
MSTCEEFKSAQRMFDSFAALKKEKLSDLIDRFITVANNLKKHDPQLTNPEQIQRLLDSLPQEWSLQKGIFEAVIQPQTNTPNVALISFMIRKSDYKPFKMIEKLKSMVTNSDSLVEIEETMKENKLQVSYDDDMEEEDLKWQIKTLTLRVSRFMERTGRNVCTDDKIEIGEVQSQINYALMTKIVDVQKGKVNAKRNVKKV